MAIINLRDSKDKLNFKFWLSLITVVISLSITWIVVSANSLKWSDIIGNSLAISFGIITLIGFAIDAWSRRYDKYHIYATGVQAFNFDYFDEIVASECVKMKGKLYFFNIPLETFKTTSKFKNIWVDSIFNNNNIKEVNILLDNQFKDDIEFIVRNNKEAFMKNNYHKKIKFKFDNIRNSSDPNVTLYSKLNFGVWSKDDRLVTMTGEFTPFGNTETNKLKHFIAFSKEKSGILEAINTFVEDKYDSLPNETSVESILFKE